MCTCAVWTPVHSSSSSPPCVCVGLCIKVYISQASPPSQLVPLFVVTVLDISHVLYVHWHMLTACRQLLGSRGLDPRVCRQTRLAGEFRLPDSNNTRASPSLRCDASVTVSCAPVCYHDLRFPLSGNGFLAKENYTIYSAQLVILLMT